MLYFSKTSIISILDLGLLLPNILPHCSIVLSSSCFGDLSGIFVVINLFLWPSSSLGSQKYIHK